MMILSRKSKTVFFSFLFALLLVVSNSGLIFGEQPETANLAIRKSLFKISVTAQQPDYETPWNPGRISQNFGTGFLIDGNRIMTNAHVVSNARFITLEKENDSNRYEARVKFIAHDCDLAILDVLDKSLLKGMAPLNSGDIPALNSTVTVWGYPIGGERLSITKGVVSRIDYQLYSHSSIDQHLAIQIDAAINPGNSGGPVLQGNALVGVAFQGYSGDVAQNVGYMIPVPVIARFLKDIEDGRYDHYVDMGISYFPLLNNAHRQALGLKSGDYGVVVSKVLQAGGARGTLNVEDVLLTIDDMPIFSDGTVEMGGERVQLSEVVERKFKGDSVHLEILRRGKKLGVNVPLTYPWPYLMQAWPHDVYPSFIVFGGLVFQALSKPYLHSADIKKVDILYEYQCFVEKELYLDRPEVIILSKVLPDPINAYDRKYASSIVDRVNGKTIRRLKDLSAALKEDDEYTVIELMGHGSPIVFKNKEVKGARQHILSQYGVLREEHLAASIVPDGWQETPADQNRQVSQDRKSIVLERIKK